MFTSTTCLTAITNLGFFNKYPSLKPYKFSVCKYICNELSRSTLYVGNIYKKISDKLLYSPNDTNLELLIDDMSKITKRNWTDPAHKLQVYYGKDIYDFLATKYMFEFFPNKEIILQEFDLTNQRKTIPDVIKNNVQIYNELCNMLDISLMVRLANIFSKLEFFIDLGCVKFVLNPQLSHLYISLINKIIRDKCEDINYEYLIGNYSSDMNIIVKNSTTINMQCTKPNLNNKIIQIINALILLHNTSKNAINNKSNISIISDINIRSIYGNKLLINNIKSQYMVVSVLCDYHFFKHYIITQNTNKEDTNIDFFTPRILSNLIIPKQELKSTNQIIIEI